MKVKFLTSVAGVNYSYGRNDEADVPTAIAIDQIAAGHAVPVDELDVERATRIDALREKRAAAPQSEGDRHDDIDIGEGDPKPRRAKSSAKPAAKSEA